MPLNKMVEAATVISSPFGSICHRKEKGQVFFFFFEERGMGDSYVWENMRLLSLLYIKVIICSVIFIL